MARYEFMEGILAAIIYNKRLRMLSSLNNPEDEDEDEQYNHSRNAATTLQIMSKSDWKDSDAHEIVNDLDAYLKNQLTAYWNFIRNTSLLYCHANAHLCNEIKEVVSISVIIIPTDVMCNDFVDISPIQYYQASLCRICKYSNCKSIVGTCYDRE